MGLFYYVVDVESTGLRPSWHEVTQISVIRCSDQNQLSRYIKAEYPERASKEALQVTGRTVADLSTGDPKNKVVELFHNWILQDGKNEEGRCFIAHQASFDKNFCHALWGSVGKKFPANLWLDTKAFAKSWAIKLGIEKPSLTLQSSLEFTGIKPVKGVAHEAIADTRNCFLLWKKGMEQGLDHLACIKRYPHE